MRRGRKTDAELCQKRLRVVVTDASGALLWLAVGHFLPQRLRQLRALARSCGGTCTIDQLHEQYKPKVTDEARRALGTVNKRRTKTSRAWEEEEP